MMTLYFLGGGNMATAIIGCLRQKMPDCNIHVANRGAAKREQLAQTFQVSVSEKLPTLTKNDVLVLAVKPQDMKQACENIQTNDALVISLAAGLTINTLSNYLNGTQRIVRAMPNTPCAVGLGVVGLFAEQTISTQDKTLVQTIMQTTGITLWLEQETQMHAITGISGSGSAYVFYLMNALAQAAEQQGFSTKQAHELSLATFKGAIALAETRSDDFQTLQQQVISKGGTTAAAITTFEQHKIAENIAQGVEACVKRSQEIAQAY